MTARRAESAGVRLLTFGEIDSTMHEADRQIAAGVRECTVIWAAAQTAGHGRHGRSWSSPPGNLYWTMVIPRKATWPAIYGLSFAAGLAVSDAILDIGIDRSRVGLKWPNDVMVDQRKISGVLARASTLAGADGLAPAVLGIGINITSHPSDTFYPATSLQDRGITPCAASTLRDVLTEKFLVRLAQWEARGIDGLRTDYVDRLQGIGQPIRISRSQDRSDQLDGIFERLGADGSIQVRLADGTSCKVSAGDVLPAF
jgi:BirA family biotin operon repressor/biotin-[acetyl-CoA-carboxylase] ligase